MKSTSFRRIAVIALAGAAAMFGTQAIAQQTRSLPTFEVDKAWPQKPANMKFGDVSFIAIDANDNTWGLSRPRTLKPEEAKDAAPPITIFDAGGKYVRGWGGSGAGYEWPERE